MKIFLSFASPDRSVAEEIQLALLGAGHDVFFDEASLDISFAIFCLGRIIAR